MYVQFIRRVFLLAKDHREHVKRNKHNCKSACRSSPNGLSLLSPSLCVPWTPSCFILACLASFSSRWPTHLLENSNFVWRVCASQPRGGGSWEKYNLWQRCLFLCTISTFISMTTTCPTFKTSRSPTAACLLLLCPGNVLKSKQKISGTKY